MGAFEKRFELIGSMCWWLEFPPVEESTFEDWVIDHSAEELKDAMDGWNVRFILDSFADRWKGARCKGREQRNYLRDVASKLLIRMTTVLEEIREVEGWIQKLEGTEQIRSIAIANAFRYWRYQELTLIRSELWVRYHHSIPEIYARYIAMKLDWQSSWFIPSMATELVDLIKTHLERTRVSISITETDERMEVSTGKTDSDSLLSDDDYDETLHE